MTKEGGAPQFGASNDRVYVTRTSVKIEVDLSTMRSSDDALGADEREVVKTEEADGVRGSPDGRWIAFVEGFEAYVTPFPHRQAVDVGPKAKSIPVRQVTVNAGEYLHWSGDSRAVHYALGDELFTRQLNDTFAFLPGAPELPKVPESGVKVGFAAKVDSRRPPSRSWRAGRHDAGDEVVRTGSSSSARTESPVGPVLDAGAARRHGDRRGGEDDHPRPRRRALARRSRRGRDRSAAGTGWTSRTSPSA